MNRGGAAAILAAMAAATIAATVAPVWLCALIALVSLVAMRVGRRTFLAFSLVSMAISAALFAVFLPGDGAVRLGFLSVGPSGALLGLTAGLRLAAILGLNLAVLSWASVAKLLDAVWLPARATAFLGAVLIAAHDLGRDSVRLVDAQRLAGAWPHGLWRKARTAAALLPPLALLALRRAATRAEALRLAGHDTGPRFAPLVAVTALAVAARLALVAVPNVSLTYVVVFAGGLVFGMRVGALAGLLGMAFTNLLLTGLYVVPFANAPAMALVGVLGGLLRGVDFSGAGRVDRWAGRMLGAACGLAATVVFSLAADAATWAIVPEFRSTAGTLRVLVLSGLAFNAPAAIVNAVLFAAAVGPLSRAARAGSLAYADGMGGASGRDRNGRRNESKATP